MTERVKGQTVGESLELFEKVHDLLTGAVDEPPRTSTSSRRSPACASIRRA